MKVKYGQKIDLEETFEAKTRTGETATFKRYDRVEDKGPNVWYDLVNNTLVSTEPRPVEQRPQSWREEMRTGASLVTVVHADTAAYAI